MENEVQIGRGTERSAPLDGARDDVKPIREEGGQKGTRLIKAVLRDVIAKADRSQLGS